MAVELVSGRHGVRPADIVGNDIIESYTKQNVYILSANVKRIVSLFKVI